MCEEKKKLGEERIRLTLDEPRGEALTDKCKSLEEYFGTRTNVVLYFKDMGMQIGWTTVFLVEYFGPILMTVILSLYQE